MTHRSRSLPVLFLALTLPVAAQNDFSAVEIETIPVADGIFMLTGAGGNIGLSVGDDGAFLIDDQFAPLSEKIRAAVAAQTDAPIRFVVNTHWHGDHVGGNAPMAEAGAIIVAHENVRVRMHADRFVAAVGAVPESLAAALPIVTFSDAVTFHWNDETIRVSHVDPAHTDGDALIYFADANVLHTGDTYFNGFYPYIDVGSGGAIDGMIAAADHMLELVDDETRIIPGHGPLSDRAELQIYRDVLAIARDRVAALIAEGKDRDAVVAARPMAEYDAAWGAGFMAPDRWIGILYDSLSE